MGNLSNDGTVTGEIIRVLKKESKYGQTYFDVQFKLLHSGSFIRSCVYTACRNYENWRDLLRPGNILGDLEILETKWHKLFINADSMPRLIRQGNPEAIPSQELMNKVRSLSQSVRTVKNQLQLFN